ncbi:MFS transporter [uncultured Clostridium sp.]|uniref:MFS transporter n=1 Tax=uncultured Clostridium sp. TaxID=59620 RepID=UPI0026240061|nr:MFS transporter [uncultured Clostridium sp.]
MKTGIFSKKEFILIIVLGLILGMRQIAVGIVTPFIASYTASLTYGTLALGGICLGLTSLSKGLFQIPFGNLGDKLGNKRVILIGLSLLLVGLLIILFSNNAYMFMLGRALQGSGAIVGAGYALLSNLIKGEKRIEAISLVSVIVGIFSAISLGFGPVLRDFMSIKEMYLLSIILVIVGISLIIFLKDDKEHLSTKSKKIVLDKNEKKEYVHNLVPHKAFIGFLIIAFMTQFVGVAGFFIVPQYLDKLIGQDKMWIVFTPAILLSLVIMKKSSRFLNSGHTKRITLLSGICMLISIIILLDGKSLITVGLGTFFLFTAFNILTTVIPVIANKIAKDNFRGLVNGIVNTSLFIGNFIGASILGILWTNFKSLAFILLIIGSISIIIIAALYIE